MAIELLDFKKNWGKIKAGFGMGKLYRSPAQNKNPSSFVPGYDPSTNVAQMTEGSPKGSVFGGKTFSQRK